MNGVSELFPVDDDVRAELVAGPPTAIPPSGTVDLFYEVHLLDSHECESTAKTRFRLELTADGGFRDRIYFGVEASCNDAGRPPDEPDFEPLPGSIVESGVQKDPNAAANLHLWWTNVGADDYNIWRGHLASLWGNRAYDHSLGGGFGACNIGAFPGSHTRQVLVGDGSYLDLPIANFYYLVTAENPCTPGFAQCAIDGPFGFANADLDFIESPAERRPGGTVLDSGCTGIPGACP